MNPDSFNLQRFVDAQEPVWEDVQAELVRARKRTHWMWFIFPQLAALGRSETAKFYGISGTDEARAYMDHTLLGSRLIRCCDLLLKMDTPARDVFGEVDAVKLKSCLTLFDSLSSRAAIFDECLDRFFAGERDARTLERL